MGVTYTHRLIASKPDGAELVAIALLNANFDKFDADFRPAASMSTMVGQAFTSGVTTQVIFDVLDFDSYAARAEGAMVNLSTDTITIRKAGLYYFTGKARWAANATGVRQMQLAKNGTSLVGHSAPGIAGTTVDSEFSHLVPCAVNDAIILRASQNSGGSLSTAPSFVCDITLQALFVGSLS